MAAGRKKADRVPEIAGICHHGRQRIHIHQLPEKRREILVVEGCPRHSRIQLKPRQNSGVRRAHDGRQAVCQDVRGIRQGDVPEVPEGTGRPLRQDRGNHGQCAATQGQNRAGVLGGRAEHV